MLKAEKAAMRGWAVKQLTVKEVKGLEKGQYIVEINELNGLGFCTSEEEIEVLYEMLTKQSIYK